MVGRSDGEFPSEILQDLIHSLLRFTSSRHLPNDNSPRSKAIELRIPRQRTMAVFRKRREVATRRPHSEWRILSRNMTIQIQFMDLFMAKIGTTSTLESSASSWDIRLAPRVFESIRRLAGDFVDSDALNHNQPILGFDGLEKALAAVVVLGFGTDADDCPHAAEFLVGRRPLPVFEEAFDFFAGVGGELLHGAVDRGAVFGFGGGGHGHVVIDVLQLDLRAELWVETPVGGVLVVGLDLEAEKTVA